MAIEYRDLRGALPEIDGDKLTGRAVPFDTETQIGPESWGFKEKVNRNALNKTLREQDIALLDQHDTRLPIARTSAGTLTLTKRNGGCEWDAEPTSKASYVADALETVRAGNYGGCSIGFEVIRDKWTDDEGRDSDRYEGTHREVLEARLFEVSLVTFPAYLDTNVQMNSANILSERRAAYEATQGEPTEGRVGVLGIDPNAVYGTSPHGGANKDDGAAEDDHDEPDSPDETAYEGSEDDDTSGTRASSTTGEPDESTRENDEYETARIIARNHEVADLMRRMSDLG